MCAYDDRADVMGLVVLGLVYILALGRIGSEALRALHNDRPNPSLSLSADEHHGEKHAKDRSSRHATPPASACRVVGACAKEPRP